MITFCLKGDMESIIRSILKYSSDLEFGDLWWIEVGLDKEKNTGIAIAMARICNAVEGKYDQQII